MPPITNNDNILMEKRPGESTSMEDQSDTENGKQPEDNNIETGVIRSSINANGEEENHDDSDLIEKHSSDITINNDDDNGAEDSSEASNDHNQQRSHKISSQQNPYGDDDSIFIKIPVPGLPLDGSSLLDPTKPQCDSSGGGSPTRRDDRKMRLAPGLCTICLSNYQVRVLVCVYIYIYI